MAAVSRARPFVLVVATMVAGGAVACARSGGASADAARSEVSPPPPPSSDARAAAPDAVVAVVASNRLAEKLMAEIQLAVERGGNPPRMGEIIADYSGQPDALIARKTALYVLKSFPSRSARLAALIEGGGATSVAPEDDPLWREVVGALSETWARDNITEGRRWMMREKRPRARRLLVSSIAIYAASNRGLSDLRLPARRALRAELMRLYPNLPWEQRRDIDAALPKLVRDVPQGPPSLP
jgi:hypothetical protein